MDDKQGFAASSVGIAATFSVYGRKRTSNDYIYLDAALYPPEPAKRKRKAKTKAKAKTNRPETAKDREIIF